MILSSAQAPAVSDEETVDDEESDQEDAQTETDPVTAATVNVVATDIAKGVFRGKAFSGELSNQYSKDAQELLMDTTTISIGENISEILENMVWPCKEKKDPCTPTEFFKSKGYDPTFLQGKKTEYDKFKSDTGVDKDDLCLIIAFWQNRIFPVCFTSEGIKADFSAIVVKNFINKMESRKINPIEINKKP